jgi:hypothetical protein
MGVYRQDEPLKFCLLILGQHQKLAHLFRKKSILLLAFSSNVREANGMRRVPSSNELPFATLESRMFQERPFLTMTCFRAQESSARRTGRNFLPKGVGAYSTLTGISANISLLTSPSLSSSRNCCVSTFCEIRGILCRRPLNRRGSSLFRSHHRITGFHRPPISTSSSSIGHLLAIPLALIDLK